MSVKTQTKLSKQIEKLKQSNKLNKILIAKTLVAFTRKAEFDPPKNTYFKICSKPIFVYEIGAVLNLQDLKKLIGP